MSPQITPESLRLHAEWLRLNAEKSPIDAVDCALGLEILADGLQAREEENAYVLELAKHMAATAHPNMRWDEWTSGTPGSFQDGFITEARACLEKLEADGRLRPPVVDAEIDEPKAEWATWEDVPKGVRVTAPGVGRGETFEKVESGSAVHRFESGNVCCAQFDAPAFGPFVPAEGVAA